MHGIKSVVVAFDDLFVHCLLLFGKATHLLCLLLTLHVAGDLGLDIRVSLNRTLSPLSLSIGADSDISDRFS